MKRPDPEPRPNPITALCASPALETAPGASTEGNAPGRPAGCRENLRAARMAKGMTQQQVAEKLGVSDRHYQRIESGETIGKIELWDALEDLFGINQRVLREIHPDKAASR